MAAKKKVLLLTLGQATGGVESYLERLCELLISYAELHCLCAYPPVAASLRARGVRVTLLPQVGGLTKPLAFLLSLFVLPMLILRSRIHIVQVNGLLEAIFLLEARLFGAEAIYTRHGPFEDTLYRWYKQPTKFLPRYAAKTFAHAATLLICVSEDTRLDMEPALQRKAVTIPHWLPCVPRSVDHAIAETAAARLLCVARLEEYKGVQFVIEALRQLPGVTLQVVGAGSYLSALETLANGLPVSFAGYQKDPARYFSEADIFVMPSLGPEGSSLGALEAMASGLPCVLSDLPVYREISGEGRAAMHFRGGDVRSLVESLSFLLHNQAAREALARAGSQRVLEAFSPEVAMQQYVQALRLAPMQRGKAG